MKLLPILCCIALAAAPGAACAQEAYAMAGLGDRVRVADGVFVMPLAVVEDSRCPASAHCIWAGRLVLSVRIFADGRETAAVLTLGAPQAVGEGYLTLETALPEPRGGTISPQDYSFSLRYAPVDTDSKAASPQ
jgi:hypothetical protein